MTGRVLWEERGAKTVISLVQNGQHFGVWYTDRETGEEQRGREAFGAARAWEKYWRVVRQRVLLALAQKYGLPTGEGRFRLEDGRVVCEAPPPELLEELLNDWCTAHDTVPERMSEEERGAFAMLLVELEAPDWLLREEGPD